MAMRKLRLDVENLQIESFVTNRQSGDVGTVRAHESDIPDTTTFDLGNYTGGCSAWCIPQDPQDPNDKYRLPNVQY